MDNNIIICRCTNEHNISIKEQTMHERETVSGGLC
jgi:hypothetical protein